MKIVKEMPKEGQFIACWRFNGKPWAGTFRYVDEELHEFNEEEATWEKSGTYFNTEESFEEVTFLIVGH